VIWICGADLALDLWDW